MSRARWTVAGLCLLAAACGGKPQAAQDPSSKPARPPFYYDLGPSAVDISSYPTEQRANYRLFLSVCSTCHTPARPLNAPIQGAAEWSRYLDRMHIKMAGKGIALSEFDQGRILSFLVFDAKTRKAGDVFHAEQERLKAAYAALEEPLPPVH